MHKVKQMHLLLESKQIKESKKESKYIFAYVRINISKSHPLICFKVRTKMNISATYHSTKKLEFVSKILANARYDRRYMSCRSILKYLARKLAPILFVLGNLPKIARTSLSL